VLRNRRAAATDGPPWVKFIALNPATGIALIDLLPAQPEAAVAPLEEFLARTGFTAFSRGDPPIVAVPLRADEISALGNHIDAAFADAAPCGIRNENWPTAIAELLMSTQGLLLSELERAVDRPTEKPTPAQTAAPPAPTQSEAPPAPTPPKPPAPTAVARPLKKPVVTELPLSLPIAVTPRRAPPPVGREPATARTKQSAPPQIMPRPEPRGGRKATSPREAKPMLDMRAEGARSEERVFPRERRERHPIAPWIFAASLSAVAAIAVFYPLRMSILSPSLRQGSDDLVTAMTKPQSDAATTTATSPSASVAANPDPSSTPTPPDALRAEDMPRAAVAPPLAPPPTAPQTAVTSAPTPPPTEPPPAVSEIPSHQLPPDAQPPENPATLASLPPQTEMGAGNPSPSDRPARATPPKRVKHARVKLPADDDGAVPGLLAPPSPGDDTVTIDGTTYVKGREPHALGTVAMPNDSTDAASQPLPSNPSN